LQPEHQAYHCWTISFPPYGCIEGCYHVMKAVCGWFWTGHALLALWLSESLADFSQSL
jgi:hypothetical protein